MFEERQRLFKVILTHFLIQNFNMAPNLFESFAVVLRAMNINDRRYRLGLALHRTLLALVAIEGFDLVIDFGLLAKMIPADAHNFLRIILGFDVAQVHNSILRFIFTFTTVLKLRQINDFGLNFLFKTITLGAGYSEIGFISQI